MTGAISPEELTQRITDHALWLESNEREGKRLEFVGANLEYGMFFEADLAYADLRGAHLFNANLRECNLTGANLAGARLEGASMVNVILIDADLTAAILDKAVLPGALFERAKLERASLRNTNLLSADFSRAALIGADFTDANLAGGVALGADLTRANLSQAKLMMVDLTNARLTQACFDGAVVIGTVFEGAESERCRPQFRERSHERPARPSPRQCGYPAARRIHRTCHERAPRLARPWPLSGGLIHFDKAPQ